MGYAEGVKVPVSLVLVLNEDTIFMTDPKPATLYDEDPGKGYEKCIALPNLHDVNLPPQLRNWVRDNAKVVVVHSADADIGKSGRIGITSEKPPLDTETKDSMVLRSTELGQITIQSLKAAGHLF